MTLPMAHMCNRLVAKEPARSHLCHLCLSLAPSVFLTTQPFSGSLMFYFPTLSLRDSLSTSFIFLPLFLSLSSLLYFTSLTPALWSSHILSLAVFHFIFHLLSKSHTYTHTHTSICTHTHTHTQRHTHTQH